nr:MAG: hypothetical protein [Bacteriophage sp.]
MKNLTPPANGKNSPAPGRQQQQKRPGRPTHNAPPPRPFFFLPAMPGRSHCTACSSQRPPRTGCTGHSAAALPAAYHASAARLPYASIQQTAAPYCTACTLPAMQQPAPPAALPRLPDRRRARPALGLIAGPLAPPACRIAAALALPGPPRRLLQ